MRPRLGDRIDEDSGPLSPDLRARIDPIERDQPVTDCGALDKMCHSCRYLSFANATRA